VNTRNKIPLSLLRPRLVEKTITGTVPSYRRLWESAVNGDLPSAKLSANRWYVEPDALPAIAEAFGLVLGD
jgi:hypothetical protein